MSTRHQSGLIGSLDVPATEIRMFGFGPVEAIIVGGLSLMLLGIVIGGMAGVFYLLTTGTEAAEPKV
ncbi:hypothetical protein [Planctomicrobium sp. SH664]|uniref:hypothetical protein n=1 Tax=Planctomicrobium sp. SH664 TaxID=3448125 RepID=UPI003F5C78B3